MLQIKAVWHKVGGAKIECDILGFVSVMVTNPPEAKQEIPVSIRPAAIVRVPSESRLRYIDLKYLEVEKTQD